MSMPQPPSFSNPYASPEAVSAMAASDRLPLPTYSKVVIIADLVLCSLRGLLVVLSIVGYLALQQEESPMLASVVGEILTGVGIAIFGITGNALLLARKRWAVALGYLAALFALGSVGVGLWQLAFVLDQFPAGSPQRIGAMIGGGFVAAVRVLIIGLYVAGLLMVTSSARRVAASPGSVPRAW